MFRAQNAAAHTFIGLSIATHHPGLCNLRHTQLCLKIHTAA